MRENTNLSKLELEIMENEAISQIKGGATTPVNGVGLRSSQDDKRRERPGGIQTQVKGRTLWGG